MPRGLHTARRLTSLIGEHMIPVQGNGRTDGYRAPRAPRDRHRHRRGLAAFLIACGAVISVACSSPASEFSRYARHLGMREQVVEGTVFHHVVFASGPRASRTLHVYLDGDGTPWGFWTPSADPTPRNPLVLRLMALDPTRSLYLGRPCYHGLAKEPPCTNALWTSARYSEAVVSSMASALRRELAGTGIDRLVWFGHSGGGALAMLLAPRFDATTDVVTVAANLDIDAWAELSGYAKLDRSLNPARQPPLPPRIREWHYVGGKDSIVPPEVVARGTIDPRRVIVISEYNHTCCWEAMWPSLVSNVDRAGSPPP